MRAPARPITDEDREQLRALHAQGLGRNQIAKQLRRSGRTISNLATELGLTFERGPEVAAATAAVRMDNKARRVALIHRAYTRAEKIYGRLEADETHGYKFTTTTIHGIETEILDHVPGPEERALASAASQYLTQAAKLEAIDGDSSADAARSMLGALADGIRRIAGTEEAGTEGG